MTIIHRSSVALAITMLVAGGSFAQVEAPGWYRSQTQVFRSADGLPGPSAGRPGDRVQQLLASRGRQPQALSAMQEVRSWEGANGVRHFRFEQFIDGMPVYGGQLKAAFNRGGELVQVVDQLATWTASSPTPSAIGAQAAVAAAAARLYPGRAVALRESGRAGTAITFDAGVFFFKKPSAMPVAIPLEDGTLQQGWLVQTWTLRDNQLHHTLVGGDGRVLDIESRTASDSYGVFEVDPGKGPQVTKSGPGAGNAQSPQGWLSGVQATVRITGNNVYAYLDADANGSADTGGTVVTDGNFTTAADLTASPATATNKAVAVQNLFYLNNVIHDRLYRHGFNEAAGNFQNNNFSNGGSGNDAVLAEAQDGGGTDNANFSTPADGSKPRMQMYLWTGTGTTHEVVVGTQTFKAMPAQFGTALTTTGLGNSAFVVASPIHACSTVTGAVSGKFALIERGGPNLTTCDFVTKVYNAQLAGAKGVVIYNNVDGTDTFTMGGTNRNIKIPSVMISQNDGAALKSLSSQPITMRKSAASPLQKDGDLDSDIVYHEYGHGLTWRMIGGMSGALAGAIGEGMSDGLAMLMNADYANPDVIGEYSAGNPLGIRRYRYEGYPLSYSKVTGTSVHSDGEIYAAVIWKLITAFGQTRRDDLFTYIVDGMNYTPATPSYEKMREGILQAIAQSPDTNTNKAQDTCTVWRAFAAHGIGQGASGVVGRRGLSITESFAVPSTCP